MLDLEPLAPADDYLARRASLGGLEASRRLLAAAGMATLLVDTGLGSMVPGTELTPMSELADLAGATAREVVRLETLADAIMESTVKQVLESRRPENERSATWTGYWREGMNRALDLAEPQVPAADGPLDMVKIALACAGLYFGFRMPDLDWRSGRPNLSAFCDAMDERPSFAATRPA